jgi:GT2 family glycosyltransferase
MMQKTVLSIVIPTYRREGVLLDTVGALLQLMEKVPECCELILLDQTEEHDLSTTCQLEAWQDGGAIRWLRESVPHITRSMNIGVRQARGAIVLFLDDDIIPSEELLRHHIDAYENPDTSAIVGQVLQPEENFETLKTEEKHAGNEKPKNLNSEGTNVSAVQPFSLSAFKASPLRRDLGFKFNSSESVWVENAMAGNLSVRKEVFFEVGGFDENFTPPVASRFETEFAKRMVAAGRKIRFEPAASIRHLRAEAGGTRSRGNHLMSASPIHGVGDYYYALTCGRGLERMLYILRRPFREIRTKFHLTHPWWVPAKLIGECRAMVIAYRLYRQGPRRMSLFSDSHGEE